MRTSMKLIGLTGNPGAGKDSVAVALAEHGFGAMAFADPLRREIATAFRLDSRLLTDRATKEIPTASLAIRMCLHGGFRRASAIEPLDLAQPRSPRDILRLWGTEYRRQEDPNYWTAATNARIRDYMRDGLRSRQPRLVVTDVRFRNEAALIQSWGGEIWRVHRLESLAHVSEHLSDTELASTPADRDVHNDGSLQDLALEVSRLLQAAGLQASAHQ